MITLLALATLSFASPLPAPALAPPMLVRIDEDKHKGPDAETIKKTLADLKLAFAKGTETPERLAAIERANEVPSKEVAKALGKGLKDKDTEVVTATLTVLAKMDVDEALDRLTSFYKKDRRLKKDEELLANTLKAIAWRGDPSTIDLLRKDVFTDASKDILRARILGLGRARTPEAVEAVMDLMKSAGRNKIQPYMDELSLSLTILTGVDHGKNQDRWISWWNDNKHKLDISEEPPKIAKPLQNRWDKYWGLRPTKERGKKREDRGGD